MQGNTAMSEENEYRRPDYEENDLFPSGNTPKPLFPQVDPPSVKPLFESSAEQETVIRTPFEQKETKSIEVPDPVNNVSEGILAKPSEAPTSYRETDNAPEIPTPVIVGSSADPEGSKKIQADPPAPVSEPVMTEKAPVKTHYEEVQKAPDYKTSDPVSKPRYGQIRERMPVVQGGKKEVIKRSLAIDLQSASLGAVLKAARTQSGLTVQQAAEKSRIKVAYINALEADNFDLLPKGIFPNAYVRSLCGLYRLDDETCEHALRKVAENLEKMDTVPAELLQQIDQNVQRNEQEEKRITKIFYTTVFCGGLLLILIVVGIIMAAVSLRKPNTDTRPSVTQNTSQKGERTPPVETFDIKKLEALTPAQIPCLMQELSVPQK